jgi:hypothetical protein
MSLSWIAHWLRTLWGRITTLAVGIGAILALVNYAVKWQLYPMILNFLHPLQPVFLARLSVPSYMMLFLATITLSFIILFLRNQLHRKQYFITIRSKFNNGYEPNEYSRQTRWRYKQNETYYYIPLLVYGYDQFAMPEFRDFCGPYCSKCDHLLQLDGGGESGRRFFCVNCVKKYKIPVELVDDYTTRLFRYFQEEYRQRRLGEASR